MGVQRAREVLLSTVRAYSSAPAVGLEEAILRAAEEYGGALRDARNARDRWKLRKRKRVTRNGSER